MTGNALQTLQQLVQDVIAADVRDLRVRVAALERLVDERFRQTEERLNSMQKASEMQVNRLLAAISESKANSELAYIREISKLRERVAVIESKLETRAS